MKYIYRLILAFVIVITISGCGDTGDDKDTNQTEIQNNTSNIDINISNIVKDINISDDNISEIIEDINSSDDNSTIAQIISVTIPNSSYYKADDSLDFHIIYDRNVTVENIPTLSLDINNTIKNIPYIEDESNSTDLLFRYIIPVGIEDIDGLVLSNNIDLNDSNITDDFGNEANTTFDIQDLSSVKIDSVNPIFTNDNNISIYENTTTIVKIQTKDITDVSYTISSDYDGDLVSLDSNNNLIFNTAPDYESSEHNTTYTILITAKDEANNETNQTITVEVKDNISLYIKSVVYDDNLTKNDITDDIVYIYFSDPIDENTLSDDINSMFDINGTGNFDDANATYNSDFNLLTIFLDENSTAPIVNNTKIYLTSDVIQDANDEYPNEFNQTVVFKYNHILKTNTTKSDDNPKEDAEMQLGISRLYTSNNDTVDDNITYLTWEDDDNISDKNYSEAYDYCENLTLDGKDNWTLPTIKQLLTLVDYNQSIDYRVTDGVFQTYSKEEYWSSTSERDNPDALYAWSVSFDYRDNIVDSTSKKDEKLYVRCVLDTNTTISQDLIFNSSTVLDPTTRIMWKRNATADTSWEDALSGCYSDQTQDYDDWRVPNINELQTIIKYDNNGIQAIDEDFRNFDSSDIWSSTRSPLDSAKALAARIYQDGAIYEYDIDDLRYYICIRNY